MKRSGLWNIDLCCQPKQWQPVSVYLPYPTLAKPLSIATESLSDCVKKYLIALRLGSEPVLRLTKERTAKLLNFHPNHPVRGEPVEP